MNKLTKEEFIERIHKENIRPGDYLMMLTKITDVPLVLGCVHDNGKWNIFETLNVEVTI